jgi:hypothetical protein
MPHQQFGTEWSRLGALRYKWHMLRGLWGGARRLAATEGITALEVIRRYRAIRRAIPVSPPEFFRYRLWDDAMTWAERTSFLTWAERRPLERFLNPTSLADQVKSKLKGDAFLAAHDLSVPRRIGSWPPPGGGGDVATLTALLADSPDGVVIKPERGDSGDRVMVFTSVGADQLQHASGEGWPMSRLLSVLIAGSESWLIQERLLAHPELAQLAGTPFAATLRVVTCRRESGRVFLLPVTLKLPNPEIGIDNFGAGNVAVAVGFDGTLGGAAHGLDGPIIDRHPTTGMVFAGRRVPHFEDAVAVARRGQSLLPGLRAVGWDIAITPGGPVVLEANAWWGLDVIQQPGLRGIAQGEFLELVREIGAGELLAKRLKD